MEADILATGSEPSGTPPTKRGLLVNFCEGGNSAEYKLDGWSTAAGDGSRTNGTRSTLRFPRPAAVSDHAMVLRVKPFSVGEIVPHHRVRVLVNGQVCASLVIRTRMTIELWLPWSLIGVSDHFEVELDLPDAERPSAFGDTSDRRLLALIVRSIVLRRVSKLVLPQAASGSPAASRHKDLMMNFVSLGTNCEVGLMQRMCGAEPLGLFRFAAVRLAALSDAIEAGLGGIDDPATLGVAYDPAQGASLVRQERLDFGYLLFERVDDGADTGPLRQREARRLGFLRRKFLEDLSRGDKLWVLKSRHGITPEQVWHLVTLLRARGPATVLWVDLADATHAPGEVAPAGEGLIRAWIDRFAPVGAMQDSSAVWLDICRRARALADAPAEAA